MLWADKNQRNYNKSITTGWEETEKAGIGAGRKSMEGKIGREGKSLVSRVCTYVCISVQTDIELILFYFFLFFFSLVYVFFSFQILILFSLWFDSLSTGSPRHLN